MKLLTQTKKLNSFFKIALATVLMLMAFGAFNVAHAGVMRSGPVVYYQGEPEVAPCYTKRYVPAHWYRGYYVPGQYVTYSCNAVREEIVYIPGHYHRGVYYRGHYRHVYYRY